MKTKFDGMQQIHGEYSGTSSSVQTLAFYDSQGNQVSVGSSDQLVVTEVIVVNATTSMRIDVFDDWNGNGTVDAGERIVGGVFAVNGGIVARFEQGRWLKVGDGVKCLASGANQYDVQVLGYIRKVP